MYSTILENVLYFPQSPVNVLSVTAFATQLNDDTGTWIKTSRFESTFSWDNEKLTKTLVHPASKLPQMNVNDGFPIFTSFCQLLEKTDLVPINAPSVFLSGSSSCSDPASPQLTDGKQHNREYDNLSNACVHNAMGCK